MESFKHKNKEIVFWSKTGEVISQNKYSETHVSSSGGGGSVGPNGGYVSAPTVHSRIVTKHEFWIRKEDGSEESIQLSNCDVPLREGHKITLILAGYKGGNHGYYTVLVNHSANKHWFLENAASLNNRLLKIDVLSAKSFQTVFVLFIIAIGIGTLIKSPEVTSFLFLLVFGYAMYRLMNRLNRVPKMTKDLNRHLESLAQAVYKQ